MPTALAQIPPPLYRHRHAGHARTLFPPSPLIDVRDVAFTYPDGDDPAVEHLDFSVERGEIFGFLGPSGAGKSTTQKMLIGLLRGYHGTIRVLDRDLSAWGSDYYEHVGVSFELPNHFQKLTARENLRYFGALYERRHRDPLGLLQSVGLAEDADTPVGQFSKGMKSRLTFARALVHDPTLLFLDEPTSGLDPGNARRIRDLIREQQQAGKTIFLTTHNMAVAEDLCDRVAFIVGGRIALIDTPRDLKLRYGQRIVDVEYRTSTGSRERAEFAMQGLGENPAFLELLRGGGIETIHTREASLEDIFIRVTGRSLE
jgi:fluoroquinolone transport system ATP-binding protein